jgi:ATP-dependent DNA helicase RecG
MFEAIVADTAGMCRIIWFHGGYLRKMINPGDCITATGKVTEYKHQKQLTNPRFIIAKEGTDPDASDLSGPVYPAAAKLSSPRIRRIIRPLLQYTDTLISEYFSDDYLSKRSLIKRPRAFKLIHNPAGQDDINAARRRLKYDELFIMQLGLALKRYQVKNLLKAPAMTVTEKIDTHIRRRFPFMLTADQDSVIAEIVKDMSSNVPMNRLLQGDVGSGKTVVALYAALLAVANKTQAAVMAPTEILAAQHMVSLEKFLRQSDVRMAMVTGQMKKNHRKQLLEKIAKGDIDIVVGTHALIQDDIEFAKLGVVIIDEQHKFGVHQRSMLKKKHSPHFLVMTATPIPRTLAMTAFGDLDVSVIKHSPPGRGQVVTRWVKPDNTAKAMEFIRKRLKTGRQAYFVYPRIENIDEDSDIRDATSEHKRLSEEVFSEFSAGLLHGRMSGREKQKIMADFRTGKINILVSTVVIEVGMDVPNATIMVIEHADRFGLAQLHQLRGRIGRGQNKSYCLLFSDSETEQAKSRLNVMTRTSNGFEIAEHDLGLRGPGELFSPRQHGMPDLKIADIVADYQLLAMARRDAFEVVNADPVLTDPAHRNIRKALLEKFSDKLSLVDVG